MSLKGFKDYLMGNEGSTATSVGGYSANGDDLKIKERKKNGNREFAVLGLGRFGMALALELSQKGYQVLACDKNPVLVKQLEGRVTAPTEVDFNDEAAVKKLDLQNYDVVVIAIGTSIESAIMATVSAKEVGVKCVIVKALTFQQKRVFEKLGADRVIMPEYDSGKRLAEQIINPNMLEFFKFSENYGFAEIEPKALWLGKSLKESGIRAEYGLNIVAIKRNGDVIVNPYADEVITEGDILVVIGENEKIQSF